METFNRSTPGIFTGHTNAKTIRFVVETVQRPEIDLSLTHRDWDVTDPEARETAAKEELGDDYAWYSDHREDLQWWVNISANAAVLAIYRPR